MNVMNVTSHLIYLDGLFKSENDEIDTVISDKVFIVFVNGVETNAGVVVNEAYFYENGYNQLEEYTFDDFEELFDGIIRFVSSYALQVKRRAFVAKLEECIAMHRLVTKVAQNDLA
jgi:hypothetical protein